MAHQDGEDGPMTASNLIDISPPVDPASPVWPGDVPFSSHTHWPMSADSPVAVASFTTTGHVGAHADAPAHFVADGATAGQLPLDTYLGPCQVIDCSAGSRRAIVTLDEVRASVGDTPVAPRLLIRTYERAPGAWDDDFPGLDPAVLAWFAEGGGRLIGVDTASLDPMTSQHLPAHHAAYQHRIAILENLLLAPVPAGTYELIALPLRLMTMDASPVRAVLRHSGVRP
jgi:arylformamidase